MSAKRESDAEVAIAQFITADQAAKIMGVHRRHVLTLAKSGKVESVRLGWVHLIRESSARGFVRDTRGRKTKANRGKPVRDRGPSRPVAARADQDVWRVPSDDKQRLPGEEMRDRSRPRPSGVRSGGEARSTSLSDADRSSSPAKGLTMSAKRKSDAEVAGRLAANLLALMDRRGLSQSELARTSGVCQVTISNVVLARNCVSVCTVAQLAAALGATVDRLLRPTLIAKPRRSRLSRPAAPPTRETTRSATIPRTTTRARSG